MLCSAEAACKQQHAKLLDEAVSVVQTHISMLTSKLRDLEDRERKLDEARVSMAKDIRRMQTERGLTVKMPAAPVSPAKALTQPATRGFSIDVAPDGSLPTDVEAAVRLKCLSDSKRHYREAVDMEHGAASWLHPWLRASDKYAGDVDEKVDPGPEVLARWSQTPTAFASRGDVGSRAGSKGAIRDSGGPQLSGSSASLMCHNEPDSWFSVNSASRSTSNTGASSDMDIEQQSSRPAAVDTQERRLTTKRGSASIFRISSTSNMRPEGDARHSGANGAQDGTGGAQSHARPPSAGSLRTLSSRARPGVPRKGRPGHKRTGSDSSEASQHGVGLPHGARWNTLTQQSATPRFGTSLTFGVLDSVPETEQAVVPEPMAAMPADAAGAEWWHAGQLSLGVDERASTWSSCDTVRTRRSNASDHYSSGRIASERSTGVVTTYNNNSQAPSSSCPGDGDLALELAQGGHDAVAGGVEGEGELPESAPRSIMDAVRAVRLRRGKPSQCMAAAHASDTNNPNPECPAPRDNNNARHPAQAGGACPAAGTGENLRSGSIGEELDFDTEVDRLFEEYRTSGGPASKPGQDSADIALAVFDKHMHCYARTDGSSPTPADVDAMDDTCTPTNGVAVEHDPMDGLVPQNFGPSSHGGADFAFDCSNAPGCYRWHSSGSLERDDALLAAALRSPDGTLRGGPGPLARRQQDFDALHSHPSLDAFHNELDFMDVDHIDDMLQVIMGDNEMPSPGLMPSSGLMSSPGLMPEVPVISSHAKRPPALGEREPEVLVGAAGAAKSTAQIKAPRTPRARPASAKASVAGKPAAPGRPSSASKVATTKPAAAKPRARKPRATPGSAKPVAKAGAAATAAASVAAAAGAATGPARQSVNVPKPIAVPGAVSITGTWSYPAPAQADQTGKSKVNTARAVSSSVVRQPARSKPR